MKYRGFFIALFSAVITGVILLFILSSIEIDTKEKVITILLTTIAVFLSVWAINSYFVFREINLASSKLREHLSQSDSKQSTAPSERLSEDLVNVLEQKDQTINHLKKLAAFRKEFIADVSHELKTPIFAAQGFVHTLLDGAVQDKAVRSKFLKKAARSLDGLDVLVQDLVTLSQMEIGELRMHREFFDIGELAEEAIEQFENRAEKKSVKLQLSTSDPGEILAFADPNRIFQVLSNLISNAINYTNEGGEVTISIETKDDQATVKIIDSGIGIPNEDLSKIFTRFYRVDKSRSRQQGGTGLGLAIVKHIIELHKSTITVESELEKGSTFSFILPQEKPKR